MTCSIVYSSRTGNTRLLAETIRDTLPAADCLYCGTASAEALQADRIYVGFWTDKGSCDEDTAAFLQQIGAKEVFLFGTAGFGGDPAYFGKILHRAEKHLSKNAKLVGTYMCQGKMPLSVRARYVKMKQNPVHMPNLDGMIENFDKALSHPDAEDLAALKHTVLA